MDFQIKYKTIKLKQHFVGILNLLIVLPTKYTNKKDFAISAYIGVLSLSDTGGDIPGPSHQQRRLSASSPGAAAGDSTISPARIQLHRLLSRTHTEQD